MSPRTGSAALLAALVVAATAARAQERPAAAGPLEVLVILRDASGVAVSPGPDAMAVALLELPDGSRRAVPLALLSADATLAAAGDPGGLGAGGQVIPSGDGRQVELRVALAADGAPPRRLAIACFRGLAEIYGCPMEDCFAEGPGACPDCGMPLRRGLARRFRAAVLLAAAGRTVRVDGFSCPPPG